MIATIHPSGLSGIIKAPASKSSMQRACAAALLSKGKTIIRNAGRSNDDKAALAIIKKLGAGALDNHDEIFIDSNGFPFTIHHSPLTIECGESGLGIRMFTPIAALSEKEITVTGEGSLLTRPMNFFDEILPQLGVKVKTQNGKLPLVIQGPLQAKNIEIDGSLSSQFLTGLLMAYSAAGAKNVSIKVNHLKSKPYIDLTMQVMKDFGMRVPENRNYETFYFSSQTINDKPGTINYTIEGDWSGGAFLLVAGCIAGAITVRGLDMMSTQADKKIMEALENANASVAYEGKAIKVRSKEMNAFEFDATDCPDLFPPLVSLAVYCKGETRIHGVSRLVHKESNRAVSLQNEFGKMGAKMEVNENTMIIQGNEKLQGAQVHSHHDHRIAMALAVAALKAEGDTIIEEAESVKKSYPDFFDDLKKLGADVSLNNKISFT